MPHDSIPSPALLTEAEIAEIEARVTNATPGPWQAHHRHIHYTPDDDEVFGLGLEVHGPPEAENRGQFARGADAQFIAHARDDIPRLIAHIRELHRMIGAPYADAPDTGAVAGEGNVDAPHAARRAVS